jgi:para-aminobenzoate synthetase/4-amino-4-deoxychorismate lyase
MDNQVVVHDAASGRWLRFREPVAVVVATDIGAVRRQLQHVEQAAGDGGLYAAGFLAYEAAPAFDRALRVRSTPAVPLLWFGLYRAPQEVESPATPPRASYALTDWQPSVSREAYTRAIARIKDYIARGDTYQVNYTFRLRSDFEGDAWALFADLSRAQRSDCAAYVDTGAHVICSASPELFFERHGGTLTSRPMKGTAPRGRTLAEDNALAGRLQASEKDRAENVMIVDMIRNDMGRVADIGSVRVPRLCQVERYPTALQMTSTVTATTDASLVSILGALFPCASITGAPKVRTMQIIAELETAPRGVYTGCIGFLTPEGRAQFNVAIRTVVVDRVSGQAEYGVGGGIVWDSSAEAEYEECRVKARVLTARWPAFRLLETILWRPDGGYYLLERHLRRLMDSAAYFGFDVEVARVHAALAGGATGDEPQRVRLLVDEGGGIEVQVASVGDEGPARVGLAAAPVASDDVFLYHKTTHREVYKAARAGRPDCDDVILWNERGEITEATTANVVARLDGALLTPPVDSGLLAGTLRAELVDRRTIGERVITREELAEAEEVFLINSVRGWRQAVVDG